MGENNNTGYALGMVGGVITLVVGILIAFLGAALTFFLAGIGAVLGAWGIIAGILMIVGSMMLKGKNHKNGSLLLLVFSILGLITMQGLLVGPILGLIGSIFALSKTTPKSRAIPKPVTIKKVVRKKKTKK